jgi:hypothetical protein
VSVVVASVVPAAVPERVEQPVLARRSSMLVPILVLVGLIVFIALVVIILLLPNFG